MGKIKVKAIAACLGLFLVTMLNGAGQAAVFRLSPVQTWGDLTKLKRIDLGNGVNVRLGLSANHTPLYSGVLIYCLTEGLDYFTNANISEPALGPLYVSVSRQGRSLDIVDTNIIGMVCKGWNTTRGCTLLFARPVLMDLPGTYNVVIKTESERVIATATVSSDNTFYHPWMPFQMEAESVWERAPPGSDMDYQQIKLAILSVPGGGIGINAWSGCRFQVVSGLANLGYSIESTLYKPPKPKSRLPQIMPDELDPDLKVSFQEGIVTIASKAPLMGSRPDWRLLARWWVNDKPFVPKVEHGPGFGGSEVCYPGNQVRFQLRLDPAKLGARPGDRVGFQMAFSDGWYYVKNPYSNLDMSAAGEARLTKRIDFVVK